MQENPDYLVFTLDIVLAVSNKLFIDIKNKFLTKIIILFMLSILFFFISIFIIKGLTYPSIEKLIAFSGDVTKGKADAGYSPGRIVELNKIGYSMETMVNSLKTANKEIQREMEERKRTENSLETKDIHLRTLIGTIPELIWLKDKDGKYLFCNSRFERFFGSKEEEIVGKTDYDFVDKELADFFRAHDQKAIDKGKPRINEEEVVYVDDGHREIWETIKTPIFGTHNELIGALGIARDITDRKEHLNRFRTVMDSLEALVYVADMESYEVLFVNKYGKNIWGDITGKICWQTMQSNQEGPCAFCTNDKLLDSHLKSTGPVVWEFQNTVDNEWYECRDQAITWMDGRLVRMEISTNITQRKEAEKQKNILEEKLRQSHKMEAVGTLAGGIAHDFNNILGIIIGNTELALDDIREWNPARSNLEEIKIAGLRAKDVVHQLLSFSRKTEQKKKPVQISPIIKESIKLLRSSMPTSIDIQVKINEPLGAVKADPTQIQQIIINLCTNAAHAMEKGGGLLKVGLNQIAANQADDLSEGMYLLLTISDSGGGVDPEIQDKIFDPYFTTKEVSKGWGLLLSTVLLKIMTAESY